jgi:hypothetical protein
VQRRGSSVLRPNYLTHYYYKAAPQDVCEGSLSLSRGG